MLAMPMDDSLKAIGDDFAEGDIFISNDPEATRGMATHLPDVFFWKPIFDPTTAVWCAGRGRLSTPPTSAARCRAASHRRATRSSKKVSAFRRANSSAAASSTSLPKGFPGQLPHSGPELGRHEGVRRRAQHRRAPRARPGRAVWPLDGRAGHRRRARLRRDAGAARHQHRTGRRLHLRRLHGRRPARPGHDPHPAGPPRARRRVLPGLHRHRSAGPGLAQHVHVLQKRPLEPDRRSDPLAVHDGAGYRLQRRAWSVRSKSTSHRARCSTRSSAWRAATARRPWSA